MAITEKSSWGHGTTDDEFGAPRRARGKYKRGIDKLALMQIAEKYDLPIDMVLDKVLKSMTSDGRPSEGALLPRGIDLEEIGLATALPDSGEFATLGEHVGRKKQEDRENMSNVNIAEEQLIESKQLNRAEREYIARQKAAGNPKSEAEFYDLLMWNRNAPNPEDRGDFDSLIYGENAGAVDWVGEADELQKPPTAPPPKIVRVEEDLVGDIEKELAEWTPYPEKAEVEEVAAWTPPPRRRGEYGKGLKGSGGVTEEAMAFEYPEGAGDPEPDSLDYNPRHEEHQRATEELIANLMPQGHDMDPNDEERADPNTIIGEDFLVTDKLGPQKPPEPRIDQTDAIKNAAKLAADKAIGSELIDPFADTPSTKGETPSAKTEQAAAADTSADDLALMEAIGAAGIPTLQNLTRGLAAAGKPRNRAYKETMARMQQSRNVGDIDATHTRHDKSTMARRAASDLAEQTAGAANVMASSQRSLTKQKKEAMERDAKAKAAADAAAFADRVQTEKEREGKSKDTHRRAGAKHNINTLEQNKKEHQENLEADENKRIAAEDFDYNKLTHSAEQAKLNRDFQKKMKVLDRALQREISNNRLAAANNKGGKKPKRPKKEDSTKILDAALKSNKAAMTRRTNDMRITGKNIDTADWLKHQRETSQEINAIQTKTREGTDKYTPKEKARLQQLLHYQEYLINFNPDEGVAIKGPPKKPLPTFTSSSEPMGPVRKKKRKDTKKKRKDTGVVDYVPADTGSGYVVDPAI
ncbi:MAG: hypothetical protein Unbinned4336contig1001_46 [Prokaryotic dsDNA virus sp.]|mgnify:CR=1 FL=1|nr:MAG: hypothetical protein Unbinned4336contig1001_46 [Prokaryotic dsDNA virus sp.]